MLYREFRIYPRPHTADPAHLSPVVEHVGMGSVFEEGWVGYRNFTELKKLIAETEEQSSGWRIKND
jgi:hypothetical protein